MNDVSASAHPAAVAAPYRRYLWVAIALVLLLAVWGILSRLMARSALAREAHAVATPTVLTTKPHRGPAADTLVLPGSVQAYYEAPIYARTSGYLKAWHTDIGAPVKKGELLAEIETPEVDQQLRQAEADLNTARANYELARTTTERWQGLLATESVSQQDADQRAGDAAAKAAAQASAAANLARLRELEGFKRVVAPFEGVVTQRNTDIGALINAGQTPGSALFRVADTHRLRIYVQVPQAYAAEVRTGMNASLEFTDHPGQHYAATVTSTAHALDATSRTLQVELQIDNTSGELLPGAYVQVTFSLTPSAGNLRVPVNAVIFRGKSPQVATVDDGHRVRLRDIAEGRDFGTEVEVLAGIGPNDTVILNPPDSIADGSEVRVQPPQPQPGSGGAAAEHS
jgi:RND family efflux transporter MFP subunit